MMRLPLPAAFFLAALTAEAVELPPIQYNALSEEARACGQLARYENAACTAVKLQVGGAEIVAQVPKMARAYDIVPITYTLTTSPGGRRVAVEATAFADSAKADNKNLYDLAIPGKMDVKIEYLGSVTGEIHADQYVPLTPDPKTPASPYIFSHDPLVRSGEIRAGPLVWFKWKLTNSGDTILDPEGFGAAFGEPWLTRLADDGREEWKARPINLFVRFLNYLYPGESAEIWTLFSIPQNPPDAAFGLTPGNYRLDFKLLARLNHVWEWSTNIWGGTEVARLSVPLRVSENGAEVPVTEKFLRVNEGEKMPGYIDSFEEFMTSFNIHKSSAETTVTRGTLFLQVAPWTKDINLKLILDQPMAIDAAQVPITVSAETMVIEYNADNPMVVGDQPAFLAQAMPGMRTGIQLGPDPDQHLRAELREMKELGVNVIVNTAGDWAIPEIEGSKAVNPLAAQYRYYYDKIAREEGMKLMGWSLYPPTAPHWYRVAQTLLKKHIQPEPADSRYAPPGTMIDLGDPIVPEVIAAYALYNYHRWGDMWFQTKDGTVPIDIEDSMGWLRDDINIRYPLGKIALQRFREWLKKKYQTIEAVNLAWKTNLDCFDEIDPQANQGAEDNNPGIKPVYNNPGNIFHDWTQATEDWDHFRTWLRMDNYTKALAVIRKEIPTAKFELRTEGGNMVVPGDARSEAMHARHLFYSQRRNAMVYDEVKGGDVIGFYSDYTTLPYTKEELGTGLRQMVKNGIIPTLLPQFDHMRDILINNHYGRDYQTSYNLDQPAKGMMIHCLTAAYPWWKTTYEAGGAPGILWSDYLCDGFATETQKRELSLLTNHFRQMKKPQETSRRD